MEDILLFVLRFAAIWFIWAPVVTVLHELGHAAAALLLTNGWVRVWLGSGKKEPHLRLGRLHISITSRPGFVGFYDYNAGACSRATQSIIILARPLVSLLIAAGAFTAGAGLFGALSGFGEGLAFACGYVALAGFLATAIPWTYPQAWGEYGGLASDGLRLVRLWRRERSMPSA